MTSTDGFCSAATFEPDELGQIMQNPPIKQPPLPFSPEKVHSRPASPAPSLGQTPIEANSNSFITQHFLPQKRTASTSSTIGTFEEKDNSKITTLSSPNAPMTSPSKQDRLPTDALSDPTSSLAKLIQPQVSTDSTSPNSNQDDSKPKKRRIAPSLVN